MLVSFDNNITLTILMITILRLARVPICAMLAGECEDNNKKTFSAARKLKTTLLRFF